ncbi:pirin [uncultured Fibrella sp.]|uniref:pirin n=1 Tax=uncultured Fibrella sp. TaxID=1284596 RepID=UPI0035C96292
MTNTQVQAQIFLADQRGSSETDFFRSYHTVNFDSYVAEGREPFGALWLLNDDTLRPGASLTMQAEQPVQVVLMPIIGGLEYAVDGATHFLKPGQVGVLSLASGMNYSVINPYPSELINCLQLWLTMPEIGSFPTVSQINFDLSTPNTLQPFLSNVPGPDPAGFIGRFAGREEGTYPIGPLAEGEVKRMFVFVLQGAFEVANRLLHEKDGLALTYQQEAVLEFEALSNEAILIVLSC